MKQFLVFLLTLLLSLPSYAGGFAMVETDHADSSESPYSVASFTAEKHNHHSMMGKPATKDHATGSDVMANHDCCDESTATISHVNMDCSEECSDCNHGCGACLALLPETRRGLQSQAGQTLLIAVQLPASPYQNPLIPPIISQ